MRERLRSCLFGSVFIGAATVLSAGCTSTPTTMTDVWRDPSYAAGPMRNLVVFGGNLNATNRRTLEDGFVSALAMHGVRATASYRLFPNELPPKEEARAAVKQIGADGVLVSTMKGVNEKVTVVPGSVFWGGFYGPGWGGPVWDPGYIVTDDYVRFETSLWDPTGDGRMVWSAVTQTENPRSGRDFVSSLTKSVTSALVKAGLLPRPTEGNAVSYAPASTVSAAP